MNRLSKFLALSLSEKTILVRAWGVLTLVRIVLVLVPFCTIRSLITKKRTKSATPEENITTVGACWFFKEGTELASADKYAWAVTLVSRYVPAATCLVQAIALKYLLQRSGHPASIQIGVNKDEAGGLRAHAWVESRGRILIGGSNLKHYTRLWALE